MVKNEWIGRSVFIKIGIQSGKSGVVLSTRRGWLQVQLESGEIVNKQYAQMKLLPLKSDEDDVASTDDELKGRRVSILHGKEAGRSAIILGKHLSWITVETKAKQILNKKLSHLKFVSDDYNSEDNDNDEDENDEFSSESDNNKEDDNDNEEDKLTVDKNEIPLRGRIERTCKIPKIEKEFKPKQKEMEIDEMLGRRVSILRGRETGRSAVVLGKNRNWIIVETKAKQILRKKFSHLKFLADNILDGNYFMIYLHFDLDYVFTYQIL